MTGLILATALALREPVLARQPASAAAKSRPAPSDMSPLQPRIDAAEPGATIEVTNGIYGGDLIIDRPLHLRGKDRPRLIGSGSSSVIQIRADAVTIEGFDVDGRGGGDLGRDTSGIHVAGRDATIRDCRIVNSLFGVYLREANGAVVERCHIQGIPGKDPGEKGSGIHVWNTDGFRLSGNEIVDVRDGFYIQSSSHGTVTHNIARDLRYGLHYMFSDDNLFEDNLFENGAAGTALMYSKRITFRRNRFVHNRGFASVGLLFKSCEDVVAEDNLIADNVRGIFLEGSYRNLFRHNVIAESDVAIVLYDSCANNRFVDNSFVANLALLSLVGRRTDTAFDGNYWSDNEEQDIDGDGRSDRPYRLSSVFDHLRGNLTAADLMSSSLAASALGLAERMFPVLELLPVQDRSPLGRPPDLSGVPKANQHDHGPNPLGLAGAGLCLGGGATIILRERRARWRVEAGK